jgi:integrase/recombinase XerC
VISMKDPSLTSSGPSLPGQLNFLPDVTPIPLLPEALLPSIEDPPQAFHYADGSSSMETYLVHCQEQSLAPETAKTYQKCVARFLEWWRDESGLLDMPLTSQVASAYGKWLLRLEEASKITEGRRAVMLSSVRRWAVFLVATGRLASNPFQRVEGPDKPADVVLACLSEESVRSRLATMPKTRLIEVRDYVIALLMLRTGIRETELCEANVGDVVPLGELAFLQVRSKGKKRKKREPVVLRPDVYEALQQYLNQRRIEDNEDQPLCGDVPLLGKARLRTDYRLTPHEIRRRLKPYFNLRLMALRQTAAVHALMNGAPLDGVQEMMRHESIETTKLYKKIANRLQRGGERFLDHLAAKPLPQNEAVST